MAVADHEPRPRSAYRRPFGRHEALALEGGRRLDTEQFQDGRQHVDDADRRLDLETCRKSGAGEDHRDTGVRPVDVLAVPPVAVLAHALAVVAQEQGVAGTGQQLLDRLGQPAEPVVDVVNFGLVAPALLPAGGSLLPRRCRRREAGAFEVGAVGVREVDPEKQRPAASFLVVGAAAQPALRRLCNVVGVPFHHADRVPRFVELLVVVVEAPVQADQVGSQGPVRDEGRGFVAGFAEKPGKDGDVGSHPLGVSPRPVGRRVERGEDRGEGRTGLADRRVRVLEQDARGGQGVDCGRLRVLRPVDADGVRAQGIHREQDEVWIGREGRAEQRPQNRRAECAAARVHAVTAPKARASSWVSMSRARDIASTTGIRTLRSGYFRR